ncbi:C40 family peptidase [Oscillibacter valericigenes]|nr:C40 family peptidase [Oscillibacter valericigenes]
MKQEAIKEKKAAAIKGRGGDPEGTPPFASSDNRIGQPRKSSAPVNSGHLRRADAPSNTDNLPAVRGKPQTAIKERPRGNAPAIKTRQAAAARRGNTAKAAAEKAASGTAPKAAKATKAAAKTAAKKAVGQTAQVRARQLAVQRAKKAAQATANLGKKAAQAVVHAATALVSALVGLVGGAVLLLALCVIMLVAAVVSSPFGIFFADQQKEPDAVSPNAAIAQINVEYTEKLADLQADNYDSIQIHGQPPDWREVLAVFSCKTASAEDGVDVATLDPDRVERLRQVFWDMTAITTEEETVEGEDGDETILHITIEAKTVDDMREIYTFTDYQNEALDALLEEMELLGGLLGDLSITQADAVALLENLPDDLSPERKAVIQHALTLVGKVNYFWGGKSLVLGWDSRWGTTMQVTAAGSSSTGTYRPYGMDCSGFVDWVFYNATGGEYIIGHGGGASAQHSYCTAIAWDEALPGDLVFYPEDSHVGIVGGRDENGNLLIIHCASGANNVVITGVDGFTSIGRPVYFTE